MNSTSLSERISDETRFLTDDTLQTQHTRFKQDLRPPIPCSAAGAREKVDMVLHRLGVCSLRESEISRQWV
jgi:hypothetical protein